jgi:hypothetical protein
MRKVLCQACRKCQLRSWVDLNSIGMWNQNELNEHLPTSEVVDESVMTWLANVCNDWYF